MKTLKIFAFALFGLSLLSSCSSKLTYFTQDLQNQYRWTDSELKKIQFYVSRDVVLKRELTGGSSDIVSGKIKVEDGRRIEEVVIRKGTPGAFIFSPKSERFAVSFEDNDENFLMFGPSPKYSDRYVVLASDWDRRSGEVTYSGKKWKVSSEAAYAALLVDLRKISKVDVNSRVAKGRKVN
jgi:hypothetical protein